MRKSLVASLVAAMIASLTLSGCLKTRASLRGDDSDESGGLDSAPAQAVAAPQQAVQPQGGYVIDEIKLEITRLNGRIEQLERQVNQLSSANAQGGLTPDAFSKLQDKVSGLEQAQNAVAEELKRLEASGALKGGGSSDSGSDTHDAFSKGQAEFKAGKFEDAAETFNLYLKNPKAKHAEEATFMSGQAYFELKQYKKVILELSKFTDKYAKSKRAPAALLKMGQSFELLGMKDDAKGFYQEILDKHPKAPEAKKAKAKLK